MTSSRDRQPLGTGGSTAPAAVLGLGLAVLLGLSPLLGCENRVGCLKLKLLWTGSAAGPAFDDIERVEVTVIDAETYRDLIPPFELDPVTGDSQCHADLPCGHARFEVVGFSGDGSILARGGTAYVDCAGGDRDFCLLLGPAGAFRPIVDCSGQLTCTGPALVGHSLSRLRDGRVLIMGGATVGGDGGILELAQKAVVFNPNNGSFTDLASSLAVGRAFHTVTFLKARAPGVPQQLLICGGITVVSGELQATASCELFDPETMAFSNERPTMREARYGHTATLLITGNVLMAGGGTLAPGQFLRDRLRPDQFIIASVHRSADMFQFSTPTVFAQETVDMVRPHIFHVASRGTGRLVLVVGGEGDDGQAHRLADIFDPSTGDYMSPGTNLPLPRSHATLTKEKASGGLVMIGGRDASELPASSVRRYVLDAVGPGEYPVLLMQLRTARWGHVSMSLADDQHILAIGGVAADGSTPATAELIDPSAGTGTQVSMPSGLLYHAATRLQSGEILVLGGIQLGPGGQVIPGSCGTIYTPP